MSNNQVSAGQLITASKLNDITIGTSAPTAPSTGQVWVNTANSSFPKAVIRTSSGGWSPIVGPMQVSGFKPVYTLNTTIAWSGSVPNTDYSGSSVAIPSLSSNLSFIVIANFVASTTSTARLVTFGLMFNPSSGYSLTLKGTAQTGADTAEHAVTAVYVHTPAASGSSMHYGGGFITDHSVFAIGRFSRSAGGISTSTWTSISPLFTLNTSVSQTVTLHALSIIAAGSLDIAFL